ncbi:MAG: DUF1501 domain-containing protein [Pirellulales bacterium]
MTLGPSHILARRQFLQAGTLSLFAGATAARVARGFSPGNSDGLRAFGRAKRCILVYLLGGPPQIDMWDLKPAAPAEIRGPFRPISSPVAGMQFCEHLPRLAAQAANLAILRSVTFPNNDHPAMIYHTLTGRESRVPLGANTVLPPSRSDDPHMGAVVARYKHRVSGVPGYVAIPEVRVRMQAAPVSGGGRAGFLGAAYDPLALNEDPTQPVAGLQLPPGLTLAEFDKRQSLLAMLDGRAPRAAAANDYATYRESAARMVGAAADGGMFALAREPAPLRDRYGRHRFGQSLLLARRLVEHGVSFVGVHFNYMTKCDGWDTHKKNFEALKDELLPLLDEGLSALVDDLQQRGLLDETLVVTMGEFGRTPRINNDGGRDHWGHSSSVLFAGGGTRGGNLVGASDRICAFPAELPVTPADVVATIYHALGLEAHTLMHDPLGRPMAISDGRPIAQVF